MISAAHATRISRLTNTCKNHLGCWSNFASFFEVQAPREMQASLELCPLGQAHIQNHLSFALHSMSTVVPRPQPAVAAAKKPHQLLDIGVCNTVLLKRSQNNTMTNKDDNPSSWIMIVRSAQAAESNLSMMPKSLHLICSFIPANPCSVCQLHVQCVT